MGTNSSHNSVNSNISSNRIISSSSSSSSSSTSNNNCSASSNNSNNSNDSNNNSSNNSNNNILTRWACGIGGPRAARVFCVSENLGVEFNFMTDLPLGRNSVPEQLCNNSAN